MAIVHSTRDLREIDLNPADVNKPKTGSIPLSLAALTSSFAQGACVWLMAGNSLKSLLSMGSVAAAGSSSFLHSEPLRSLLMLAAMFTALFTLYVVLNGYRLRNQAASRWRRQPLSRREKISIAFSVSSAAISLLLVLAEFWAHGIVHPSS
jgi:hypothetical protein